MNYTFTFSHGALKSFKKISQIDQERIIKKVKFLKQVPDISLYTRELQNFSSATHRLRIGNIRLILKKQSDSGFLVIDLGYRGDIYKK